ncbi:hypothetical protein D917_06625 [Trichinella nativa]|uniref:Uncharacterized protein n=1 Tax=Trichinella nativa TaxID=6335 RepID=A0A1Y3ERR6_9BILA|nr:hypothetical protein D917_06625 [Trichinella nativa]
MLLLNSFSACQNVLSCYHVVSIYVCKNVIRVTVHRVQKFYIVVPFAENVKGELILKDGFLLHYMETKVCTRLLAVACTIAIGPVIRADATRVSWNWCITLLSRAECAVKVE